MAAPKGNRFWEARAKHGRSKIFETPEDLWNAAVEYFDWVEKNPLWEHKVTQYQGVPVSMEVPKMRAMTIAGLCLFLGVNEDYLTQFEARLDLSTDEGKDFSRVIGQIKTIIRNQKLEGAAADLFNANIIARELGLKERTETEHSGVVRVKDVSEMSDEELAKEISKYE